jgi:hypothetical protein
VKFTRTAEWTNRAALRRSGGLNYKRRRPHLTIQDSVSIRGRRQQSISTILLAGWQKCSCIFGFSVYSRKTEGDNLKTITVGDTACICRNCTTRSTQGLNEPTVRRLNNRKGSTVRGLLTQFNCFFVFVKIPSSCIHVRQ